MGTYSTVPLAARDHLVGIGPLVAGIGIVIGLILAVWLGIRVKNKELPPSQEPQPRAGAWETEQEYESGRLTSPDHGPGHQDSHPTDVKTQRRKPMEVPHDGVRHMPYEFGNFGSQPSDTDEPPPKWTSGRSGSWGTG
ncbi:DUF6479 family protein [Streptomyces sp. P1-3]|uniref:DUF6479 family protein n=1 Tax=Streptomyces sp. P1-3 TaxID=3421658 RepID=UPI003D366310